jgi:Xanthine and CO dehydrogenases maturation factor, XdhC/CoxF family
MHESDWDTSTAAIFHRIRELRESEIPAVLATITSVHGSSYRRPGAKMLITADGTDIGSVSAGCLEDQILALATDVIAKDAPRIETFDLMEDDDIWGLGIGCNGIIDVLLEPVDDVHADVSRALLEDQIVLTATLFKQDGPSSRVQVGIAEDAIQPAVDAPEWVEYVREMGEVALNSGQSMTRVISMENSERSVFFDVIRPLRPC